MHRRQAELDSMRYYMEKSFQITKEHNLKLKEAYLIRTKVTDLLKDDEALKLLEESIEIYSQEGHVIGAARVLAKKARHYHLNGAFEKALEIYQQQLDVFKKYNNNYHFALINRYIGNIYQDFGNDEAAIKNFLLAKESIGADLHPYLESRLNTDLAESYIALGDIQRSKLHIEESIAVKEKIKDLKTLPRSYIVRADLHLKEEKLDSAKEQYEKAIFAGKKMLVNSFMDEAHRGLLQIAIAKEDIPQADFNGKLALQYAESNKSAESKYATLISLTKLSVIKGDYKKANQYHEASLSMHNSVFDFTEKSKITNLISDNDKKKKEIEILKLENANQDKEVTIQESKFKTTLYILSLISGLVIILTLFRSYLQNKTSSEAQRVLNDSLKRTNEKLSESNKQLEQFAHMASHDLKSPLRTITSFSSLLQKTVSDKLDEKEKSYVNFITQSGKSLNLMIDDMLEYSKVGSQNATLDSIDADETVKESIVSLQRIAEENNIEIKQLKVFPEIMADAVKLKRVFQNLISNAIKFHDPVKPNKYIHLDYKELDDFHKFTITDNGIGIPKNSKDIFEPFTYLNSKEDYKGSGIGLTMCKILIEKHGGEIWYESKLEKGTTFYFTLRK